MKKIWFAACLFCFPFTMQAQLGGLINKAKNKLQQRADSKVDKAMDKTLDDAENAMKGDSGKTTDEAAGTDAAETSEGKTGKKETVVSYSKFDFVPGEKILYAEDFGQDNLGELPLTWNSSGKGEVMTLEGKPSKWVRGYQNNTLLSGNKQAFGENFTVEFDLMYYFEPKVTGYVLPNLNFGIFSSRDKDNTDNEFLRSQTLYNLLTFRLNTGNATMYAQSYKDGRETFASDAVKMPGQAAFFNTTFHYSIQVQKTRARLWCNETKIFDIPRAVNPGDSLNQLFFDLDGSNYKDDEIGYYLTNIKVATGLPDTRHKLLEEGKFSTTGILFAFQSAVIKPESYGIIKEIATVLKDNPSLNIKVVGHTSNDGDVNANVKLSDQRAAAVKAMLVKDFGIEEPRLQTEGKGPSQPVADNKTAEGKAQNRRVEFIKL